MSKLARRAKVFGLGLSKTGTSSLAQALNLLQIKTVHYPSDERTYRELRAGIYRLAVLKAFRGVTDIGVAPYYPQLDRAYPGSKFILTVREQEGWLASVRAHWELVLGWWDNDLQFKAFSEFIFASVYGTIQFNEDRFRYVYETHVRNVREYFAARPSDLLVMDICAGQGWEQLCPFLGLPKPGAPFPHANAYSDLASWMAQRDLVAGELAKLIPPGERFILADATRFGSQLVPGREAVPFVERDGIDWGPPPDDASAITELERSKLSGVSFLVIPWSAFWWLDHYAELGRYLRRTYRCLLENDRVVLFDLRV